MDERLLLLLTNRLPRYGTLHRAPARTGTRYGQGRAQSHMWYFGLIKLRLYLTYTSPEENKAAYYVNVKAILSKCAK